MAGRRGVVEAATGTGKTLVALGAIEELRRERGSYLRVVIVVPSKVLASQWRRELEHTLNVPPHVIGEQHSDVVTEFDPDRHLVLLTVVNTARANLRRVLGGWRRHNLTSLLIVDECHRSGSEFNARIFDGAYDFSLGLSATPERDDGGHLRHVYPGLGSPVYRYPLLDALDDGVLAPLRSVNLYVDFDRAERDRWSGLARTWRWRSSG